MDSNDRERIGEARDELMRMLAEDELREAVLLIFANKQVSRLITCCFTAILLKATEIHLHMVQNLAYSVESAKYRRS